MPDDTPPPKPSDPAQAAISHPEAGETVVTAASLFGDKKELWIELNGERYRLRITRRNKLILQK